MQEFSMIFKFKNKGIKRGKTEKDIIDLYINSIGQINNYFLLINSS